MSMIINGANIVGARVITTDTKKTVGQVADIVYNPQNQKIQAFLLSNGQSGSAVMFKDAIQIKENEILVSSEHTLKKAKEVVASSPKKNFMAQTTVLTKDGEELGFMKDVFFDTQSGQVQDLEVVQPNAPDRDSTLLIKVGDILSVGDDAVVVKLQSGSKQSSQKSQGLMEKTKKAAKNTYKEITSNF